VVETLKAVVDANEEERQNVANKVRGGMNRDQFQGASQTKGEDKKNEQDDGDKEYYFDCNVLDKFDTAAQ
jgi:hypothetical protein